MKTYVFIFFGIVLFAIIAYTGYNFATTRTHSPLRETTFSHKGLDLKVTYCQPYKKGRLIFGTESDGALVPFGKYWRLGANDAAEITFSKPVVFVDRPIAAGSYRIYAVPGPDSWEISLNSELGKFGAYPPDYSFDVLKVNVPVNANDSEVEQFTILFTKEEDDVQMDFLWDKTIINIPIRQR
jgi:hypothetical protein